ncbi:MAG: glycosyltransferase family 9 protein [Blastocatellia bacterium]
MTPKTPSGEQHRLIEEAAQSLAEFRDRRDAGLLNAEYASRLSLQAAENVINFHHEFDGYLRDAVTLLCEITASENQEIARAGVLALFPALVERLNDSFDPAACKLYDRIFAQVIDFYRRLPEAREFDQALRNFGLMNETALLTRKSRISNPQSPIPNPRSQISKVLLLSRVTIGADVAVTSVIIARLRHLLLQAEFVLLGSGKLRELFGGDPRVRIHEIKYDRSGGVLSRLTSWIDVIEAVNDEARGLKPDEFWLIDPDSRLTQLGLLPLLKDERNYFFFESRSYQGRNPAGESNPQSTIRNPQSLGQLAPLWLDEITSATGEAFPYVALPAEYQSFGQSVGEKLRRAGASHIVAISFGVGGNPRKRLSEEFETELTNRLIADSAIILDKGASAEEREQINRIVATLRANGKTIAEINEQNFAEVISQKKFVADAITWDGGVGALAGLIAASDEYIGYDSAGQHIAAALAVPTLTIFVNSGSATFAERWRPYGTGVIEVLSATDDCRSADSVLPQILTAHRQTYTQ